MAFKLHSHLAAKTAPMEYLMGTNSAAYALGETLKLTSGGLVVATGTDVPEFIAMKTQAAENPAKTPLPVIRVTELDMFETTLSAEATNVNVGDKVTISGDGLQATATTTNGVFLVAAMDGTAAGSKIRGYFRR